tara:strand:+ start:6114 stop:6698 length:585 start_codon:yes stop_codon:yes gene_type:complete
MKIVGLTGGIGSGKTSVLNEFASLGVPCYQADETAKKLMHEDQNIIEAIKANFGEEIYSGSQLDKKKLAAIVFDNKKNLAQLNAIVHPAVADDFERFKMQQKGSYLIKEAAILLETESSKNCDFVILVTAPKSVRLDRVLKRGGISEKDILNRMQNQWDDAQKIPLADYVIENIDWDNTLKSIKEIHHHLSSNN